MEVLLLNLNVLWKRIVGKLFHLLHGSISKILLIFNYVTLKISYFNILIKKGVVLGVKNGFKTLLESSIIISLQKALVDFYLKTHKKSNQLHFKRHPFSLMSFLQTNFQRILSDVFFSLIFLCYPFSCQETPICQTSIFLWLFEWNEVS